MLDVHAYGSPFPLLRIAYDVALQNHTCYSPSLNANFTIERDVQQLG